MSAKSTYAKQCNWVKYRMRGMEGTIKALRKMRHTTPIQREHLGIALDHIHCALREPCKPYKRK